MNENVLGSRGIVAAVAVGAGVLIGAAGVFLYEHFFGEKRRLILQQEVTDLGVSLSEIRHELDILRRQRKRIKANYNSSEASTAAVTAKNDLSLGTIPVIDIQDDDFYSDDEYYELSDSEEQVLTLSELKRDSTDKRFEEVDQLLNGKSTDKTKAYGVLLDLYENEESNPEVLWRLSKACHKMADSMDQEGDTEKSQYYLMKGVEYSNLCLEVAPRCADAHKWYAICVGAQGKFQKNKEKLQGGMEFRKHVEKALEITPNDPTLHYLLGRFQFEVASLSWVERKVASALFGEVPYATYSEAVESLTKAEELSETPWKENKLLLAKCYIQMGQFDLAFKWLDESDGVSVVSPEDQVADAEIKSLLKKYNYQRE